MKKIISEGKKAEDGKDPMPHQQINPTNEEVIERLKIAMQKDIEKYGMPDSKKMEKKLHFIDVKKYFEGLE
jgi:hypothetical protein